MSVSILLSAGLGNQFFMIFAGISYALDNNKKFSILSKMNKTTNGTSTYWDSIFDKLKEYVNENYEEIDKDSIYNEPTFEYTPIIVSKNKNIVLSGYFQSEKYFRYNFETILNILELRKKQQQIYDQYISLFKSNKTIALHFRFGDYLALQNLHCVKTPDYYVIACLEMQKELKKRGDNIKEYKILYFVQKGYQHYVNEYLKIICDNTELELNNFVKISDNMEDWRQMLMMSCCNHFIIANSSFSWFGAYLCKNEDKIVCWPKIWFGTANSSKNLKDICPESWIPIQK